MIFINMENVIKNQLRNSLLREGLSDYWPGYSDDSVSDNLSDYRGETSKIINKGLKKDKKKFTKPSSDEIRKIYDASKESSTLWNKWTWATMVTTSLQDGFFIDEDLFDTALEFYKEISDFDEWDERLGESYPEFKATLDLIISKMEEEQKEGPKLRGGKQYYAPWFLDKNDKDRIKIDKKFDNYFE